MKRLLTLIIGIGVLAAVVCLSLRERPEEAPITRVHGVEEHLPATPSDLDPPATVPDLPDAVDVAAEREVVAGARAEEETFSFIVVDGRNGQPVADAEVRWADPEVRESSGSPGDDWMEAFGALTYWDLALLEEQVRAAGHGTRSGPDGRVVLPHPEWPQVFVLSGSLVGGTCTLWEDHGETTLHLWPDGDLIVRVLDASGSPCANIGVRLLSSYADYDLESVVQRATTDAEGRAYLRHAHAIVASNNAREIKNRQTWRVEAETLPGAEASQSLEASALPVEPITIRMPDTAAVELLIRDQDGRPLASELPAILVEADAENTPTGDEVVRLPQPSARNRPGQLDVPIRDGKAVFEHVGLGRQLLACAVRNQASRVNAIRFAGPTTSGERLRVELVLGADSVVLTGRAVDPEGTALAGADLRFALFSLPAPGRQEFVNRSAEDVIGCRQAKLVTDARGSFCVEYSLDAAYGGRPVLLLTQFRRDAGRWEASADLESAWTPGVHDLGDLTLDRPPILAAGVVVDELDVPVPGAEVAIGVFKGSPEIHGPTNDRGEFELRSSEPHSDVDLYARKEGFAPAAQHGGAPGRTDWRLTLQHATRIVGRVKPPAGATCRDFGIGLRQTDYTGTGTAPNISSSLGDDGHFDWDDCPPGTYVLNVHTNDRNHAPLAKLENIVARAGETIDVGLIDLSGETRLATVTVLGLEGEPLQKGVYTSGSDDGGLVSELWSAPWPKEIEEGKLRLVRQGDVLHVAIAAPEARTQVFRDVHDGDTLRMQPGIPISILITNSVSRPPEGTHFLVGVVRADLDRRALAMTQLAWYRGEFDARGEATLRAPGPGRYALRWVLEQTFQGGSQGRHWPDEQTVEVVEGDEVQRFEVRCPIDPATAWESK